MHSIFNDCAILREGFHRSHIVALQLHPSRKWITAITRTNLIERTTANRLPLHTHRQSDGRHVEMTSIPPTAKIKLRVGSMELEYEGDPTFLTGGIEALLVTMSGLAGGGPGESPSAFPEPSGQMPTTNSTGNSAALAVNGQITLSTTTIAAKLDAKSGSDLVICAMAHLELVQGKTSSSRAEILAEIKNAKQYYKQSMSKNLSQSLSTLLTSRRINEGAKDSYALTAAGRRKIGAKVAEIE